MGTPGLTNRRFPGFQLDHGGDGLITIARVFSCADVFAPGLIGLRVEGPHGALVEVNSETDFVARNAKFQEFVQKALDVALEKAKAAAGGTEVPASRELDVSALLREDHPG